MEGLRGLAVAMVFMVHYATLVQPWLTPDGVVAAGFDAAHTLGNAGVDLFFVLSGYLIYGHLMAAPQPFARYLKRRMQRIYPAFLVVLVIYLLLSWWRPGDSRLPAGTAALAVYLLQNLLLLPGMLPITPLVTVAWSLSYELFYYLAMPCLIGAMGLRQRSKDWRIGFFLVLTALLLLVFAIAGGPVRLVMFLAGVLLSEVLPRLRAPGAGVAGAVTLACLLSLLIPMPGPAGQALRTGLLFIGFFVLCLACFAPQPPGRGQAFTAWPLRWLGNMSYSYYLIHGLSLKVMFAALAVLWPPGRSDLLALALLIPAFGLTLLPSALLFLAVERPLSLGPAKAAAPRAAVLA